MFCEFVLRIIKRLVIAIDHNWVTTTNSERVRGANMDTKTLVDQLQYDPDNLLTALIRKLNLKNHAALARALDVEQTVISKIRHGKLPVSASMLIRMHEVTHLSIEDLRSLLGDRRSKFRMSDMQFKPDCAQAA